jgi:hypothetical protein
MPSKNDLSAIKSSREPILSTERRQEPARTILSASPQTERTGRPTLPKSEKRSRKILLSLTPAEADHIARKAGIANQATFIYHFLKDRGLFDDL